MFRLHWIVGTLFYFGLSLTALAQPSSVGPSRYDATAAFPDWQLQGEMPESGRPLQEANGQIGVDRDARTESPRADSAVSPASFFEEQPAAPTLPNEARADSNRLPPRTEQPRNRAPGEQKSSEVISRFGLPSESIYSTLSALVFVLGLFFLGVWAIRRGGKKKSTALPSSVVRVLGRVTLAPKHFAELVRVGNKLVLVSLTPDGPKPITEVTDPDEVDRLAGLCQQMDAKSSSQEFEEMLRELGSSRTADAFVGDESSALSIPTDLAAFRSRGGGRRG
jgi:flagellar biogenesis protein FliO